MIAYATASGREPLLEQALDLLAPLPLDVRVAVRERIRVQVHAKGDTLAHVGDRIAGLHVVAAGRVAVVAFPGGDAVRVATLEAGDPVDDVELVLCRRAEAEAVAITPVATLFLPRADVEALLREHASFAHALYLAAVERALARERILLAAGAGAAAAEASVVGKPDEPEVVVTEEPPRTEPAVAVEPTVIVAQADVIVEPAARTVRLVTPPPLPAVHAAPPTPPPSLAPAVASARPPAPTPPAGARTWLLMGSLAVGALALSAVALSIPVRREHAATASAPPPGTAIEVPAAAEAEIVAAAPTVARAPVLAPAPTQAPSASATLVATTARVATPPATTAAATVRRAPSGAVARTTSPSVAPASPAAAASAADDELGGRE